MTDQREREHAVERLAARIREVVAQVLYERQVPEPDDWSAIADVLDVRIAEVLRADAPPQDQDATRAEIERLRHLILDAEEEYDGGTSGQLATYLYAHSVRLAAQPPGAGEPKLEWHEHDPGKCSVCGAAFEWVRPGKSQATCDCWSICPVHGRGAIQYHPEGVRPNVSGYYCLKCCTEPIPTSGGSTEPREVPCDRCETMYEPPACPPEGRAAGQWRCPCGGNNDPHTTTCRWCGKPLLTGAETVPPTCDVCGLVMEPAFPGTPFDGEFWNCPTGAAHPQVYTKRPKAPAPCPVREAAQQVLDGDDDWSLNQNHSSNEWDTLISNLRKALSSPCVARAGAPRKEG